MNLKDQAQLFIRVGELLDHGFTLMETLEFLKRLEKKQQEIIHQMIVKLQQGESLYKVLALQQFNHQVCMQIYFAEKHGLLSTAFTESGQYLLRKSDERKKLMKLLQYPIILLAVLIGVGFLLNTFLLPRFETLYGSMGYEMSSGLALIIYLMKNIPLLILSIATVIIITYFILKQSFNKKSAFDLANFYASIPFFRTFYTLYMTIFLAREWSFLIKSGFSMNEILNIMEQQNFSSLLKETSNHLKYLLRIGYSFSEALAQLYFIEKEMIQIVSHGEQKGRIDHELMYYSEICLEQFEKKMESIFIVVQPLIFAFIGMMVAAIYLSIFLPMFQMIDAI